MTNDSPSSDSDACVLCRQDSSAPIEQVSRVGPAGSIKLLSLVSRAGPSERLTVSATAKALRRVPAGCVAGPAWERGCLGRAGARCARVPWPGQCPQRVEAGRPRTPSPLRTDAEPPAPRRSGTPAAADKAAPAHCPPRTALDGVLPALAADEGPSAGTARAWAADLGLRPVDPQGDVLGRGMSVPTLTDQDQSRVGPLGSEA
jgi:hypothetical protein